MSSDDVFAGSRFLGRDFMKKSQVLDSSFVVASVEAGNTTTKCILTATDLTLGKTDIIGRCVRLTRDVRAPKDDEIIFGKTISGTLLTKESLAELVRDTILQALFENNLTAGDIHFVVRSTGVTAETGEQSEMIILSLANGCLLAGFEPRKMTGYLSLEQMPEKMKRFSYLDKVYFDGAVAGVLPPSGLFGSVISNEMEGELALAGLKEAGKHAGTDFRNPCIAIDMGTTLSGRIADSSAPYAKSVGNFCGYAGAAVDALIPETDLSKSAFEFFNKNQDIQPLPPSQNMIDGVIKEAMEIITVTQIPPGRKQFGPFAVNADEAKKAGLTLFGCDVGENGSGFFELSKIGTWLYEEGASESERVGNIVAAADEIMSEVTVSLISLVKESGLLPENAKIGITGRSGITGNKQALTLNKLNRMNILSFPEETVLFAEDGLARGAAVMARCMNSLGCPQNPIGGRRGEKCIMRERQVYQNR
ncbi:MAG: methanogenesis marker 14 protein [Methanimicrococcus sp.]|nr:methanogenesis marker 14 protein [Methanimicrococcus sp.]